MGVGESRVEKEQNGFSFEKLIVYQKSLDFTNTVYDVTLKFPRDEKFSLVDQFRRAAISISLNIAEGYGGSHAEFKRYLNISKGSTRECVALITIAKMRKYIDHKEEQELKSFCAELSRMLSGLIRSLKFPTHNP